MDLNRVKQLAGVEILSEAKAFKMKSAEDQSREATKELDDALDMLADYMSRFGDKNSEQYKKVKKLAGDLRYEAHFLFNETVKNSKD